MMPSPRPRLAAALAALTAACALAACGGSTTKPKGASGPYGPKSSPAAVSRCMRANGVSGFPDPTAGSGGEGFNGLGESNTGTIIVDGQKFSGPVVQAAEKTCKEYLPGGAGPPPPISASRRAQLVIFAQCMRKHGIPLPDPTFGTGGRVGINLGSGDSPGSPAFDAAAKACGGGSGANIAIRP
jgi:hypothetical protein